MTSCDTRNTLRRTIFIFLSDSTSMERDSCLNENRLDLFKGLCGILRNESCPLHAPALTWTRPMLPAHLPGSLRPSSPRDLAWLRRPALPKECVHPFPGIPFALPQVFPTRQFLPLASSCFPPRKNEKCNLPIRVAQVNLTVQMFHFLPTR